MLFGARCDRCNYAQDLSYAPRAYVLADGSQINVSQTFAWCLSCRKVVWAEKIDDLDDITAKSGDLIQMQKVDGSMKRIDVGALMAEWRQSREGPPKCLDCGSTSITMAEPDRFNREVLIHPVCQGTIKITDVVDAPDSDPILYSPEGDRLR